MVHWYKINFLITCMISSSSHLVCSWNLELLRWVCYVFFIILSQSAWLLINFFFASFIWLCEQFLVFSQVTWCAESTTTFFTYFILDSFMYCFNMIFQILFAWKSLVTNWAKKVFLSYDELSWHVSWGYWTNWIFNCISCIATPPCFHEYSFCVYQGPVLKERDGNKWDIYNA